MANGIQDFVATFFEVQQLVDRRRELQMLEHNSRADRARLLTDLARMTSSPEGREQLGIMSQDPNFAQFVQEISPTVPTLIQESTVRGFEAMSPEMQGDVDEVTAARQISGVTPSGIGTENFLQEVVRRGSEATDEEIGNLARTWRAGVLGTTPGQQARDLTVADLPKEDLVAMERIVGGLQLSEMEKNQIAQWAAQNGIQWASLEQDYALATAELQQRWRIAELQALTSRAGGGSDISPNTLITTMNTQLENIRQGGSDAEMLNYITAYNAAADNLTQMGLYPPAPRLPLDPSEINLGVFGRIQQFFTGSGSGQDIVRDQQNLLENQAVPTSAEELLQLFQELDAVR